MRSRTLWRVASALLLGMSGGLPAVRADVHPNTAGGLVAQAFSSGEIDNVNLFNGNLVLTIPLGLSYPVASGFSYRLSLVYNNNPWEFVTNTVVGVGDLVQGIPNRCSNAGLGWRLSLGGLSAPCVSGGLYAGPDGAEHIFYPTLHEGDADDPGDAGAQQAVLYTRDGSYLRLKRPYLLPNGQVGSAIEQPDGMVHLFDGSGRLVQMRDPFGNQVNVDYGTPGQWVISDSQGRIQRIFFRSDLPGLPQTVDRVELVAFGQDPVTHLQNKATYTFTYTIQSLFRGCPHADSSISSMVSVPLLTAIGLPDGSAWRMSPGDYVTAPPIGSARCTDNSGSLLALTLPTLGRLEWTYQTYQFPSDEPRAIWRTRKPGIASRTMRDPSGVVLGTWTYATRSQPSTAPFRTLINTVTNPLGQRTEHHFSIATELALTGPNRYDYALPFDPDVASSGLFLSSRVYEADGRLLRSEYVRYERDTVIWAASAPDAQNSNRRLQYSRTLFEDDPGIFADFANYEFDGLGHYRNQQWDGNFPGSSYRVHWSQFNPKQGTYAVDPATNTASPGFNMKQPSAAWVLETMPFDWDFENGTYAYRDHCYAPGSEREIRRRTHRQDGAIQDARDQVAVYVLSDAATSPAIAPWQGEVISERYYGGDLQAGIPTNTGDPCSMPLSAVPEYQIDHTYSAGVRATSRYPGSGFLALDRTLDPTGLPASARDAAGIGTAYDYDALGRLAWSKPDLGQGGWTQIVYGAADAATSTRAGAVIRRRGNGSESAPILETSQATFDSFGRLFREQRSLPGGGFNLRETLYDGAGNKASVSELQSGGITRRTQFLGYDPFGRPQTIRPADGPAHDVTLAYRGTRQVERTMQVAGAGGAEGAARTTELYDRHGRLVQVLEPAGAGGAPVSTSYAYDVNNRLSRVSMDDGTTSQTRTFTYDRSGLLTSESHPEKGAAGNGAVAYPLYDSRGHARQKIDGANDLTYLYDSAERLARVSETGGARRTLKSFTYATANAGNDRRQGKLLQQSRFNYTTVSGSPFTVELRETFTYGGRDGRISARKLENFVNAATTPNEAFNLGGLTYDPLGNLQQLDYPQCIHAACTAPAPRTVANTYSEGLLTAVGIPGVPGAYASSISYHPNLLVNQVVHANGLTDTQANDPNAMRRPASTTVTTAGGTVRWTTGTYAYDGADNVKAIGGSSFGYDKVSRLASAAQYLEPTSSVTRVSQTYAYDAFGNLQSISGNAGRSTPTSSITNRLNGGTYDAAGNLTAWNGNLYEYDPFHQMSRYKTPTDEWVYLYTADDERVWTYKIGGTDSRWYLRDLEGKLLREYASTGGWRVETDSIYRGGLLLAAETAQGLRHYHLDHLGTPRLVTDNLGQQKAYHVYHPYGEEATVFNQDTLRTKFTGHERDLANPTGAGDDLDYMHARHCSPLVGRFLSVDPLSTGKPRAPQSWNRYAYAASNPIKFTDADGRELRLGAGSPSKSLEMLQRGVPPSLRSAIALRPSSNGNSIVTVNNVKTEDLVFKTIQRVANSPGVVRLSLVPSTTSITLINQAGQSTSVPALQSYKGLTVPSAGTATGNEPFLSSEKGITQVFIRDDGATARTLAPVAAAELGAHALPALLGQGAAPDTDEQHHSREDPLVAAAKKNAAKGPEV